MKMEQKYTIVGTQILLEWDDDSPNLQICLHEMPDGLRRAWDEWLSTIERERNLAEAG